MQNKENARRGNSLFMMSPMNCHLFLIENAQLFYIPSVPRPQFVFVFFSVL